MQCKTHIHMANLLIEELEKYKGLYLPKFNTSGKKIGKEYFCLPNEIMNAILTYKPFFRAGSMGPDFLPDMFLGQGVIHPENSGQWLQLMFEELQKSSNNTTMYNANLAYYMGFMTHYAGDLFGHEYVNTYAKGCFPSISEIFKDMQNLTSPQAIEKTWEKILIIVRHVSLEMFMDKTLVERSPKEDFTVRFPIEFLLNCFGCRGGIERGQYILDHSSSPESLCFFLHQLVDRRDDAFEEADQGYDVLNLIPKDANKKQSLLDNWIKAWMRASDTMLTEGLTQAKEEIKDWLKDFALDYVKTSYGVDGAAGRALYLSIKAIEDIVDIFDWLGYLIDLIFLPIEEAFKNVGKNIAYPYLKKIAVMISGEAESKIKNFDDALAIIKKTGVKGIIDCEAIFGRKNTSTLLLNDWGNFGLNRDVESQEFKVLQKCLNMSKLCLIGADNLNAYCQTVSPNFQSFHNSCTKQAVSILNIQIRTSSNWFSGTDDDIIFGFKTLRGEVLERNLDKMWVNDFERGSKRTYSFQLPRQVELYEISNLYLRKRHIRNSVGETWKIDWIKVTDAQSGRLLFSRDLDKKMHGSSTLQLGNKLDLADIYQSEEKNSYKLEYVKKFHISIRTADKSGAGTNDDIYLSVVLKSGTSYRKLLDRKSYDDFERNDFDTYKLELNKRVRYDEISHFIIEKIRNGSSNGDWKMHSIVIKDNTSRRILHSKIYDKTFKKNEKLRLDLNYGNV